MNSVIFSLDATQSRILEALISHEVITNECKIKGTTSYRLSKTEPKIALGTWRDNRKFLEDSMLIESHVLEKEDGRGTKPYSVTPLGITQLCKNSQNIDQQILDKILNILKCKFKESVGKNIIHPILFFWDYWDGLSKVFFKKNQMLSLFLNVLSNIELKKQNLEFFVTLNFPNIPWINSKNVGVSYQHKGICNFNSWQYAKLSFWKN